MKHCPSCQASFAKRAQYPFIVALTLVLLLGTFAACGKKVNPPFPAEDCAGKSYEEIASFFSEAGFNNLSLLPLEDLELLASDKDGIVESVSIDGSVNYDAQDSFSDNSKVEIKYHSMRMAAVPLSSTEAEHEELASLIQLLTDAGFSEIISEEVYDIDPDIDDAEFKNVISVNGKTFFDSSKKFPINANISIEQHRPYEKYTVKMHIDFIPNLIFSKYNVNILLDEVKQYTLAHGKDADHTFRLREGAYKFTFASVDSSSVKGEITMDVKSDIDASYQISCSSDKVSVVKLYLDAKVALAENQAKIMTSEASLIGKDYKSVIAALKKLGFTNIKAVPVYDIYFGTTPGTVKGVTIGGSHGYKRGNIFAKDVKIVVAYRMPYEDDPANKTVPPTVPSTAKPPATVPSTTKSTTTTVDPEIALGISKFIIESTIKDINKILGFKGITSYSIQSTGYVYFYMSYNFVAISDKERQVYLDMINKALYSQIAGSGAPYSLYKYYVGNTLIAQNKITDPYSVKLK